MDSPSEHKRQTLHLLYHELSPDPRDYTYVTETKSFAAHLALFSRLQQAPLKPGITFDDGHLTNYTHALPLLAECGHKAKFFITVGWTGQRSSYMGWAEVRALQQAGHTLGAHGWSHALLTHCSAAELRRELDEARQELEDNLGMPITTMSFPGGRFNARVLHACEDAGYTEMYTSIPRLETQATGKLVGRFNLRGQVSSEWLERLFSPGSNLLARLQRQDRLKTALKNLLGDRAYEVLWALLNRQEAEAP